MIKFEPLVLEDRVMVLEQDHRRLNKVVEQVSREKFPPKPICPIFLLGSTSGTVTVTALQ